MHFIPQKQIKRSYQKPDKIISTNPMYLKKHKNTLSFTHLSQSPTSLPSHFVFAAVNFQVLLLTMSIRNQSRSRHYSESQFEMVLLFSQVSNLNFCIRYTPPLFHFLRICILMPF